MYKSATYTAAVLVLIALVIGSQPKFFGASDPELQNQNVSHSAAAPVMAAGSNVKPVTSSTHSTPQVDTVQATPSSTMSRLDAMNGASISSSPDQPIEMSQKERGGGGSQQSADDAVEHPDKKIDGPFSISNSIKTACEKHAAEWNKNPGPGEESPWSCVKLYELLAKLAEEPRDEVWAASTERKLREYTDQSGQFTIRALECRATVCALECASLYGLWLDPSYEFKRDNRLRTAERMWSYETDPGGARVTVTLAAYMRR